MMSCSGFMGQLILLVATVLIQLIAVATPYWITHTGLTNTYSFGLFEYCIETPVTNVACYNWAAAWETTDGWTYIQSCQSLVIVSLCLTTLSGAILFLKCACNCFSLTPTLALSTILSMAALVLWVAESNTFRIGSITINTDMPLGWSFYVYALGTLLLLSCTLQSRRLGTTGGTLRKPLLG